MDNKNGWLNLPYQNKKEYASAIIEDLQQVDAIQIVEVSIPEWQKKRIFKKLEEMKQNSSSAITEEYFFKAAENSDEEI